MCPFAHAKESRSPRLWSSSRLQRYKSQNRKWWWSLSLFYHGTLFLLGKHLPLPICNSHVKDLDTQHPSGGGGPWCLSLGAIQRHCWTEPQRDTQHPQLITLSLLRLEQHLRFTLLHSLLLKLAIVNHFYRALDNSSSLFGSKSTSTT